MHRRTFLQLAPALGALASCGGSKSPQCKLALNWKPDPQFGGFYAAEQIGAFAEQKLQVQILPGGAGTPTVQMIGAGSAEFGIVAADEIVLARARGNDVVGLFAVYQNCPQGIMVRQSRNLNEIGDVTRDGILALQRGLPYARLLEKKYGFSHVKIVPSPGGDISAFLNDEKFAQQCLVISEPLAARRKGVAVKVFPVADIGYNPYLTVLATSGDLLRKDPARAKAMITAVSSGWRAYLADPKATNDRMHELNPSMDMATFEEVAEAQKPYIETDLTRQKGLGVMTPDRWADLVRTLLELGDIDKAPAPEECFRLL
jgi:NitT/TauT family transport system substrate-binding protein